MNRIWKLRIIIFIICFSFAYSANAKVVAAISTLKGLVMVKPIGSRKYIPAYKGQMLNNGEWVKTKEGVFVAIVFLDGSNIKIQQQTEVKISSYRMTAKELKTNLEMSKGQAWSDVADQGAGGEFTITTPTAVASVKGTEFDLEFDNDSGESILTVMSGEVSFSNELGELIAGAMEAATASDKSSPSKKKISTEDLPSWQKKTDPGWSFKLKPDKLGKQSHGRFHFPDNYGKKPQRPQNGWGQFPTYRLFTVIDNQLGRLTGISTTTTELVSGSSKNIRGSLLLLLACANHSAFSDCN